MKNIKDDILMDNLNKKSRDILCVGTALVDSIIKGFDPEPVSATGFKADSGTLSVGGEAVNEAVASAKLGMKTDILCFLGNDAAGDMVLSVLKEYGVGTDYIRRSEEHPTPVTTMFVDRDGNRKSITNLSHRYNFHPEQFEDVYTDTKALIMGSLFRAPFNDKMIVRQMVEKAHNKGVMIFADTKLPNFIKLNTDDIADSLPFIDYITPNEDEARYYTKETEPEKMADVFLDYGVKNIIIKLGAKGLYFKNSEKSFFLPAFRIDAVDATGAGDCFVAGLASELLKGRCIEDALIFAEGCGAVCTTAVGACTAMKNRTQIEEFIRKQVVKPIANIID